MRILNIGSLNFDYVYAVDAFVRPGETIHSVSRRTYVGGKGLNQSVACARAGARICHAGCVGTDGNELRRYLSENGVDTGMLRTVPDMPSGHAIIQIDRGGENCILLFSGANGCVGAAYLDKVLGCFHKGELLLLQNEISHVPYAIVKAKERGMRVALNLSPVSEELIRSDALRHVDWFIVNEAEGGAIAGETQPDRIVEGILRKYPRSAVVLTLGDRGVLYGEGGVRLRHGAYPVKPVDTTGAGDTFAGYFLARLSLNRPIEECLTHASKAAALAVTREGASPSIPCFAEVKTAFIA